MDTGSSFLTFSEENKAHRGKALASAETIQERLAVVCLVAPVTVQGQAQAGVNSHPLPQPHSPFLFFFFFLIYFFAVPSLLCYVDSLVLESRDCSLVPACGHPLQWLLLLQSTGSRLRGLQQFQHMGSVVVAHGLLGMWDLPGPGIKLVFPCSAKRTLDH